MDRKTPTYGGYSTKYVVDQKYALKVRADQELSGVAPLLCAGITTYSPLKRWNVGPGKKVAVAGLGGLGHMGVKIAAAMGAIAAPPTETTCRNCGEEVAIDAAAALPLDPLLDPPGDPELDRTHDSTEKWALPRSLDVGRRRRVMVSAQTNCPSRPGGSSRGWRPS